MFGSQISVLDSENKLYRFDAESTKSGKLGVDGLAIKSLNFIQNFTYKS